MKYKPLSREEWSQFWKNDTLTTFLDTFTGNYDGEIKEFWDNAFNSLELDAKIIDLCTGNGALALLAMQYSNGNQKNFELTAVDYADIDPTSFVSLGSKEKKLFDSINFHSNTNIESSGFPDNTFDCAISQFGIEYASPEKVLPELKRILKPGASLNAIVHYSNSRIVKQSEQLLEQINICLVENGIEDIALEIINTVGNVKDQNAFNAITQSTVMVSLRESYNQAVRAIAQRVKAFENRWVTDYLLSSYSGLLGTLMQFSVNEKMNQIQKIRNEISIYSTRMQDLLYAAMDDQKIEKYCELLIANDFEVEKREPFYYKKNDLLGFALQAKLANG